MPVITSHYSLQSSSCPGANKLKLEINEQEQEAERDVLGKTADIFKGHQPGKHKFITRRKCSVRVVIIDCQVIYALETS